MTTQRPGHPIFAAVYGVMSRGMEAGPIGQARRELLTRATGEVVDLGAGRGANLALLGPAVTRIHLVEPDPHMARRLRPLAPPNAVLHPVPAEHLPIADAGVDTVLATLVLCTVTDPAAVLAEIRRVLRPGGRLLVLEHVRSPEPGPARRQDQLERAWGWFAGGCHPNRDTPALLAGAGFDISGLRAFEAPGLKIVRPWITGTLARN